MGREIKPYPALIESLLEQAASIGNVADWLQAQAVAHDLQWLLAHADDGVIWGKLDDKGKLLISHSVAPDVSPPLRTETLQQARLFSEAGELLLWHDGENLWHARLIHPPTNGETPTLTEAVDEMWILWGTHGEHCSGFTLVRDGAQGLRHAIPMELPLNTKQEVELPRLWVRHYLQEDGNGFTRIVASRLLGLRMEGPDERS
jgi:CRISPR-associated protein (TIGR03984 family)